ncbi:MAG: tetratricopeptide repeat-containing sensor histidine kinase [Bacteroidales bacterium]|nr:tetratricopeptide repeat-containing sensor histidine kinase [Bacteroidales bacterium]
MAASHKNRTITFLILIILQAGVLSQHLKAQEQIIDSLENQLALVDNISRIDYMIELSELYFEISLKKSADYADSALLESRKLNYKKGEADALNKTGNIHWITSNFNAAMERYLEALDIREEIGDSVGIAGCYNNLGIIASEFNDNNMAIEYTQKAIEINTKLNNTNDIISNYINMGVYYDELGESSKALNYYFMNLNMLEEINDRSSLATTLNNIGEIYNYKCNYDEALPFYYRSLKIQEEINETSGIAISKLNLGDVYLKKGELENAYKFLYECLEISKELGYRNLQSNCYELLAKYYKEKENFSEAFKYSQLFSETEDSIFSEQSSRQFAEMQVSFESELKDREIEFLKRNEEFRNLHLMKQKNRIIYLAISLLLITFLVLLVLRSFFLRKKNLQFIKKKNIELFYSSKKLKKSEIRLKNTNENMDRFFSIIAHDLINPFHALLTLAEMLNNQNEELKKEEVVKYSQLINTSAKNLYNLLNNLLQWTKAQTGKLDNRPENLYASDPVNTVTALLNIAAREKKIELISSINKNHKVYCDENLLLTILRNLIHNAIKYSKKGGKIEISTVVKNGFVEFSIMDNGIGISKTNLDNLFNIKHSFSTKGTNNEEGTGLGLILCKEFVEIMGGKIWAESTLETGTTFKLAVPNKNK